MARSLNRLRFLPRTAPSLSRLRIWRRAGCATVVPMSRLEELRRRHAAAEAGGGAERRERQHKEGKLSARERVELLLDEDSFEELDKLVTHRCRDFAMDEQIIPGDGEVSGYG